MKKIILIGAVSLENEGNGVTQKFLSQAKALHELGAQVECIGYYENSVVVSPFEEGRFTKRTTIAKVNNPKLKRFPLWFGIQKYIKKSSFDLAYIRYPIIDFVVLRALRVIRKKCKKVIIEIPSFPLDRKNAQLIRKELYALDNILHNQCAKYVDKILYIGNKTDMIFGCSAMQIPNGFPEQLKQTPITGYNFVDNRIVLIGVSNMHPYHGYDRLIIGLNEYYHGKYEVAVDVILVGDGSCRAQYENLVREFGLGDHVIFTGVLKGDDLTNAYKNATVGIGGLGLYRAGLQEASSLKTKEYLFRGLPFVYTGNEIGLEEDFPYALKMSNDDTPIVIDKIVDFVLKISNESPEIVSEKMKHYAEEKFNWRMILQRTCGEYLV